ncbi:MAG: ATP-binding protein, partial [Candidatus Omnitrophica bacterium]|nr:ATP-binding protein [Candidatus Omnitrophota bacterium]
MIKRYLEEYILEDLKDKMVFISGPRQIGKTTLARQIGDKFFKDSYTYLNWDSREDRAAIFKGITPAGQNLVIFDEIHKYEKWKNYIKGEYDKYKEKFSIIVTGSARLDVYKKGGDSLLGRYHPYRLHPLSLNELKKRILEFKPPQELIFSDRGKDTERIFNALFKFGGFPDVFLKQSERELRRWHNEKIDRLVREDIRDVENVRNISLLQVLIELLPSKVGSLFSLNSLREDLEVTHKTISSWIDIFEKFYYHFRIYPFQSTLIKSLRKEPKLYLWDWSEIKDESVRLENLIASHLLKFCHFLFDMGGYRVQLFYLRDKEQREVDFIVSVDNKPWFCVEVKNSFKNISNSLKYFAKKLEIPFVYQVVNQKDID